MPYVANSAASSGCTSIELGLDKKCIEINPPTKIPNTKTIFHISFFQSYLKNGMFAGIQDAQMCLKEELIPKDLFPKINKVGTVKPTRGPATYQGQGCKINSSIFLCVLLMSVLN